MGQRVMGAQSREGRRGVNSIKQVKESEVGPLAGQ